jgi:hypothetical protein
VPVQSADLTVAVLRLPDRSIIMVSVYMEGSNTEALLDTMEKLRQLIQETCNRIGTQTDVILAGGISTAMTSRGGGDDVPPQEAGRSRQRR